MTFKNYFYKYYYIIKDFILYDFKYGIKNLIKYFKVIWFDRQWGYDQVTKLFIFKLKLDIKQCEKNKDEEYYQLNPEFKKAIDNLNIAIDLLEKWLSEYHSTLQYDLFEEKYGKGDMKFTPVEDKPNLVSMNIIRGGVNEINKEIADREFYIRIKWGYRQDHNAKIKAFKLIGENIEYLWD